MRSEPAAEPAQQRRQSSDPQPIDLYVWEAPSVHDPVLAGGLLDEHVAGASRLRPSGELARFADDLTARFADLAVERSDRLVVIHLSDEAPDAVLAAIPQLAWERDLVLYDPRASRVQARRHIPPAPFPRRTILRGAVSTLVGVAIVAVSFVASVALLSGLLIAAGAVIAALGLSTIALSLSDWRRSHRPDVDTRVPQPIARSVPPPPPEPEPEADPTELAVPTERIAALRESLRRAGWSVVEGGPVFGPPTVLSERYPALPAAYVEFVDGLLECVSPDETAWFLTRHDFTGRSDSGYRWDEWERMMLEVDSEAERATTRAFWDRHVPVLLTVGGDLGYLALALVPSGNGQDWGPVRRAFGSDFDEPTDVSPSFEAFLATLESRLAGPEPARAVADWLLI